MGTTLQDTFHEIDKKITNIGIPIMKKPEGYGKEYEFPTDVKLLTGEKLGSLQLYLTSWFTYGMGVLGREEAELGAFEDLFEVRLGLAMAEEAKKDPKREIKEILRSRAIENSEALTSTFRAITERKLLVKRLRTQVDLMKEQVARLSREQSRREAEAQLYR